MRYCYIILYTFMIITAAFSVTAAPATLPGTVDWTRGSVTGYSSAMVTINSEGSPVDAESGREISLNNARIEACERAREHAFERLVRHVKDIRVDSDITIRDLLESREDTGYRFMKLISESVLFREYPVSFSSTGCRTELKIKDLIPALPFTYDSNEFPLRTDNPIKTGYSGLIIDTRGQGIEPMIFPSIFSENGLEIFSRHHIDIRKAMRNGTVSYAYNEKQADKIGRAGKHPYFTVSLRGLKGCPVLSETDVRKILSSSETRNALKQCRIIFIIDRNRESQ